MSAAYLSLSDFFAKLYLFIPCFCLVFTEVTKKCLVYIHYLKLLKNNASPYELVSGHHGFWGKNPNQLHRLHPVESTKTSHSPPPTHVVAHVLCDLCRCRSASNNAGRLHDTPFMSEGKLFMTEKAAFCSTSSLAHYDVMVRRAVTYKHP